MYLLFLDLEFFFSMNYFLSIFLTIVHILSFVAWLFYSIYIAETNNQEHFD